MRHTEWLISTDAFLIIIHIFIHFVRNLWYQIRITPTPQNTNDKKWPICESWTWSEAGHKTGNEKNNEMDLCWICDIQNMPPQNTQDN